MTPKIQSPLLALMAAALAACSSSTDPGNGPGSCEGAKCDEVETGDPSSAAYDSPDDFTDRSACIAGAFADFDLSGQWTNNTFDPDDEWFAVHFAPSGKAQWQAIFDHDATSVASPSSVDIEKTDDYVFVKATLQDGESVYKTALFYCATASEHELVGQRVTCENDSCADPLKTHAGRVRFPETEVASGVEFVSSYVGETTTIINHKDVIGQDLTYRDGLVYIAAKGKFIILDVQDPETPRELSVLPSAIENERYNDVAVYEGLDGRTYALVASKQRAAVAIDVTDPTATFEVAAFPTPEQAPYPTPTGASPQRSADDRFREGRLDYDKNDVHTLFLEEKAGRTIAYLALQSHQRVDIWDVSDPRQATKLGEFMHPDTDVTSDWSPDFVHDLYVEDSIAYFANWRLGLVVVDCNDPANPTILGQYKDYDRRTTHAVWVTTTTGGQRIATVGDEDYDGFFHAVDVDPASPTFMQRLGKYQPSREVSPHNMQAFGDRVYIAHYQYGLRVLDIADPGNPREVAHYNTWDPDDTEFMSVYDGAWGIHVDRERNLVYILDSSAGLVILRMTV